MSAANMDSPDSSDQFIGPTSLTEHVLEPDNLEGHLGLSADGAVGRFIKNRCLSVDQRPTMAVFVHAGAGYHSLQNENIHLIMCARAVQEAMKSLRSGGSATGAVEMAIKALENNEITNAGLGSNLSVDGTVECDATIVDHLGRSGACGAVSNIKNPISLAKLILDTSLRTLTLRRVPPNILVGEGAKRFASEHGMAVVSDRQLVSRNALDRYKKWCEDLRKAETRASRPALVSTGEVNPSDETLRAISHTTSQDQMAQAEEYNQAQSIAHTKARQGLLRDHSSAVLTGMWNEGQPDSPSDSASHGVNVSDPAPPIKSPSLQSSRQNGHETPTKAAGNIESSGQSIDQPCSKRPKISGEDSKKATDGVDDASITPPDWANRLATQNRFSQALGVDATELTAEPSNADSDMVTDTIGAIAIDGLGYIAAGSSSGGIGMKHIGRIGPAALVGIGTCVIPRETGDDEERAVATVTSGTGEHMATAMAARKCAERLYHMTCAGPGGKDIQNVFSEGTVMQDFVTKDFMGHPGVRNQASNSAIGVLGVKMTSDGIYMHWAHNTDSFALAHMASYHKEPRCVMSRLSEGSGVNIGAQKVYKTHAQAKKKNSE